MNILGIIRNFLWIYIIINIFNFVSFNIIVNDVSLVQVKSLINTTNDYFSMIEIDEYNNCAYLYRNWNYGEIKKMSSREFWFESSYRIYISKHTNFESVIQEIYQNKTIPPIYYNTPSTISSILYYFSVILTTLTIIKIVMTAIGNGIIEGFKSVDMGDILGKNNKKYEIIEKDKCKTKFTDIVGMETVKKDLKEYVNCMKNREAYIAAGIEVPRGLLFVGSPGTGKTYMAKALAGECGATFINVSASTVSGIYVGTGPKTLKTLFEVARKMSPTVIFIDELDSIGGTRMESITGGAAMEYNSTINSLLTELDGFTTSDNILVIGATNMHQTLDPALTRSGRLERKVVFEPPNFHERKQLISMYFKNKKLSGEIKNKFEITLDFLAKRMTGLTPADIKNVANQSALIYMIGKDGKNIINNNFVEEKSLASFSLNKIEDGIELKHIEQAIDEVIVGIEKRERTMTKEEQKMVSYHESGHTLVSLLLTNVEAPVKTSIVPRGINALGYSQQDGEDKKLFTREDLIAKICVLLGGRSAEKLIFNTMTTGASDDLEKATKLLVSYVTRFGMNKQFGLINVDGLKLKENDKVIDLLFLQKILTEIEKFVDSLLKNNREELEKLATKLLETEVLNKQEAIELVTKEKINNIKVNDLVEILDMVN